MVSYQWLGLCDYKKALQIQSDVRAALVLDAGCEGVVLGLEHPTIITLGRQISKEKNRQTKHVLARESLLQENSIDVVETNRGGLATLHSPGQLVIYPIINLKRSSLTPREFVHLLGEVTVDTLKRIGIFAKFQTENPGVYTLQGKIAFVGLQISAGVSSHGISINISNDLSLFEWIVPCGGNHGQQVPQHQPTRVEFGDQKYPMDRVQNHGFEITTCNFFQVWRSFFEERFPLTPDLV